MKILGIDTSTKFLSLGVYDDGRIYEYNVELERKHSRLLVPTIQRVLNALGWKPADIDYFACGLGPGSFTGLRIGAATIKGLSFFLRKPVLGISTLDILAKNVLEDATVVPLIDAKRSLVYAASYKNKKGALKRNSAYMLLSLDEFFKKVKLSGSIVLGDAAGIYKERILKAAPSAIIFDKDYWYPAPRHLITLALERIKAKDFKDAFNLEPIYLYPKECQIRAFTGPRGRK